MRLRALFPFRCDNELASHTPFSLVRHLSPTDLRAELWVLRRGGPAQAPFVRTALPEYPGRVIRLLNRVIQPDRSWSTRLLERRFAAAFQPGDAAYVWRGCSLGLLRALRVRGHPIFLERINTMDHMARRIMADALARSGWPIENLYTPAILEAEQAAAEAADFIFSPSPQVTESLRERGIPAGRILESSYGWDPGRFVGTHRALPDVKGVTVLFVGSIGLRKGAHLLLQAWSRAGVAGRLVLVGPLEPAVAQYCAAELSRPDVVHWPYDPNPGPLYRSADVFAFPTLEEGSALVTYEAMANRLPIVTSSMGAGRIIRDGQEGLLVDPHDRAALIAALRGLAGDPDQRRALGEAGGRRAQEYTWDKVAQRRHQLIREALGR